jgi:hypothetical protein
MVNDAAPALKGTGRSFHHPGISMSLSFLIGAIIGSGAFILLGRAPAQKLVEAVQARIGKPR